MILAEKSKIDLACGIYPGMSMADYLKVNAISSHALMWMDVSPLHFKAAMDGYLEREDTDALQFGRAFHTRLLEPETFADRYAVRLPCQVLIKKGERAGRPCGDASRGKNADGVWACGTHKGEPNGVDSITQSELDRIECCCNAVRNHKAVKLLRKSGQCELVLVSEYKGIKVKSRLDKFIQKPAIIIDPKKVAAPKRPNYAPSTSDSFARSIASYGYDVQLGTYIWNVRERFQVTPKFWWLVVEDDAPFAVTVYAPDKATVTAGMNHFVTLMDRVVECTESDHWPGYGDDIVEVSAPNWLLRENGQ